MRRLKLSSVLLALVGTVAACNLPSQVGAPQSRIAQPAWISTPTVPLPNSNPGLVSESSLTLQKNMFGDLLAYLMSN